VTDHVATTTAAAARAYLARGWWPVPIAAGEKRAKLKNWTKLALKPEELETAFATGGNVGLILGERSGWLVDVDLDCAEALELADQYLPPTPAQTGRPSTPNSHRWYIAVGAKTKQFKDPHTKQMLVELRSTGGQSVVGPSIHPSGEPYTCMDGEPAVVEADQLLAAVQALADAIVVKRHGALPAQPEPIARTLQPTDVDELDKERRACAYLAQMPAAVAGQGGHVATLKAATALVQGFLIPEDRALVILHEQFNPRCEPPWSDKELRHKVREAQKSTLPAGYLLYDGIQEANDVDLSGFGIRPSPPNVKAAAPRPKTMDMSPADPGPLSAELVRVPGFISEVMDHCLKTAPYPNSALAFCGAAALQATLAGRKVRDAGDNRTNIYLLALAFASVGKDWPRKLNTLILNEVGLLGTLGERIASGEGIEDSLELSPVTLFQTDEIDSMLQAFNKSTDARYESMLSMLLTMFSSSNTIYPLRRRANQQAPKHVDQPCLILFGTAIPTHYYAALTERLLTNGFFARTVIVESAKRSPGQDPGILEPSERILETARWWADLRPGPGNLDMAHPKPLIVEASAAARQLLADARVQAEFEYSQAEARSDAVATTVWGRVPEQIRKFALLYAISENHLAPRIDVAAVQWGTRIIMHNARRMLFMAFGHVAVSSFHAECLKFLQRLREAPNKVEAHSVMLKRSKLDARTFKNVVETLLGREDIKFSSIKTPGRSGIHYELIEPGYEG